MNTLSHSAIYFRATYFATITPCALSIVLTNAGSVKMITKIYAIQTSAWLTVTTYNTANNRTPLPVLFMCHQTKVSSIIYLSSKALNHNYFNRTLCTQCVYVLGFKIVIQLQISFIFKAIIQASTLFCI